MGINVVLTHHAPAIITRLLSYRQAHPNRTDGPYTVVVLPTDPLSRALMNEDFFPPECSRLVIEFAPDDILRLHFDTFATTPQVEMIDRALTAIQQDEGSR